MKHFTKHAEKRSQQRGIPMAMLMALDAFGVDIQQKGGTYRVEMTNNREGRQSLRDLGKLLVFMADHDVYSIEGSMNEIITVGHKRS